MGFLYFLHQKAQTAPVTHAADDIEVAQIKYLGMSMDIPGRWPRPYIYRQPLQTQLHKPCWLQSINITLNSFSY